MNNTQKGNKAFEGRSSVRLSSSHAGLKHLYAQPIRFLFQPPYVVREQL